MGGSGGGGGYPIGGAGSGFGGDQADDNCEFTFDTEIFGPVPALAGQLSIGDQLNIQLVSQQTTPSVGVFSTGHNGQQIGSIAGSNHLPKLVKCLQEGVLYGADVVAINGSQISIRVSNK